MMRRMATMAACVLFTAALLGIAPTVVAGDDPCEGYVDTIVIDVKPCKDPNVLYVDMLGILPVCLDVNEGVTVSNVTLQGVPAEVVYWSEDHQCALAKFDAQTVIGALGSIQNGNESVVELVCDIEDAGGGATWCGWDVVTIIQKGRR